MKFLFHTAIGVNSEMAYYNVFHIGGGKYKLELQDSSFNAADLSSEIVIWKHIRGPVCFSNCKGTQQLEW